MSGEELMSGLTPMLQQYLQVKNEQQDAILFFRLGDFYEMFFEDAELASRELEITLTSRDAGSEKRAPMCGVPHHAADAYIARLVEKGYKVAICEQVEDPKTTKGIVKREVVRVVTPGTIIDNQALAAKQNNYLMAVAFEEQYCGLAFADASTGEFAVTEFHGQGADVKLVDELVRLRPVEVLVCQERKAAVAKTMLRYAQKPLLTSFEASEYEQIVCDELLSRHFSEENCTEVRTYCHKPAIIAAGVLIDYLVKTQKNEMLHIKSITPYRTHDYLILDGTTRRNLELTRSIRDGSKYGTLLDVVDYTRTAMGGRLLRQWIEQPLVSKNDIEQRLDAVEELVYNVTIRSELQTHLHRIYDLERLIGRLAYGSANARDLLALKGSLLMLPMLQECLKSAKAKQLTMLAQGLSPMLDVTDYIAGAIHDEPPLSVRDGNIIKTGFSGVLDELRGASREGKTWLSQMEASEREKSGIKSLKISFNKVFGYYFEITRANLHAVPDYFIRKQTLANAERYITPELKKYEDLILGAEEKSMQLEYQIFTEVRETLVVQIPRIQKVARSIAVLDTLVSIAECAARNGYSRPQILEDAIITIMDGRHPVVEKLLTDNLFVPNDTYLDNLAQQIVIITGPNMAGKSTYMRQVSLIVLMAQMGSFVPAREAKIGVVDRIFTRVGANDDLATGQSTFMVEMMEVADILAHATAQSLLIFDEIGRGTSTFDGMSIAQSVVEYTHEKIKAKTLFATHYHELTHLEDTLTGVKNYCVAVKEQGATIVFLRRIIRGGADRSYGIHVAQLAGLPAAVIKRAEELLVLLENQEIATTHHDAVDAPRESVVSTPINMFSQEQKVLQQLASIDVISITPIEALNLLYKFQRELRCGEND
jgi:DNA mismatch repair protein MutS